jgi:hypothetical protein
MNVGAVPLLRYSCCQVGAVLRYVFCWVAAVTWGEYKFLLTISSMISITQWSRPPLHSNPLFPAYTTITITTTITAATCRYCCCLCHHCCHQCHHASAITIAPYGCPTFIISPLRLFGLNHLSMFEHNQIKQEDGGRGMGFLCGRSTDLGQQLIVLRLLWDASGSGNEDGLYAGYGIVPSVFQQGGHQYFDKSRTLGKIVCPNYSLSPIFGIPFLPCVEFILLSPYTLGCVMISYLWTQTALLLECLGWNLVLCFN